MKHIAFSIRDFRAKVQAASTDISDIDQLRAHIPSTEGASFMVARTLYVWVGEDKTTDDGLDSIKPTSVSSKSAGRYRRAGLTFPPLRQ